jgi:hypothetical protein
MEEGIGQEALMAGQGAIDDRGSGDRRRGGIERSGRASVVREEMVITRRVRGG